MMPTVSLGCMSNKARRVREKPPWGLKIAARRAELDKSLTDIDNETNGVVYTQLLYRIESGRKDPGTIKANQLEALLAALKWTPNQWRVALGEEPIFESPKPKVFWPQSDQPQHLGRRINVYPAGTGPAWDLHDVLEVTYLPEDMYPNQDVVGLKAMGDSMAPYLPKNAIAVIVLDDGQAEPGDYCGVWLSDDGVVIKRFVQESPTGELLLESLNPEPGEPTLFTAPLGSRIMGKVDRRILEG